MGRVKLRFFFPWRVEYQTEKGGMINTTWKLTIAGAKRFGLKQSKAYILDERIEQYVYYIEKGLIHEF